MKDDFSLLVGKSTSAAGVEYPAFYVYRWVGDIDVLSLCFEQTARITLAQAALLRDALDEILLAAKPEAR